MSEVKLENKREIILVFKEKKAIFRLLYKKQPVEHENNMINKAYFGERSAVLKSA